MGAYLPDLILFVHFAYVLFCVGGEIFILLSALLERIDGARKSSFFSSKVGGLVRNRMLRLTHLLAVGIVGVEGALGVLCPLTIWEYAFRRKAGQQAEEEIPLIARIIRQIMFYDFPPWVFTVLYVGFALLVLATFFWVPPVSKAGRTDRT